MKVRATEQRMTFKDPVREKEYYRQYWLAHREQKRRIHHRSEWKASGLNPYKCERLYESRTRCDICGTRFDRKTQKTLDHDRESKIVRGVLCGNCNLALGLFNENPDFIASAIRYLNQSKLGRATNRS